MANLIYKLIDYPQFKLMGILLLLAWPLAKIFTYILALILHLKKFELTEEQIISEEEKYVGMTLKDLLISLIGPGLIGPYLETLIFQWLIFRLVGWIIEDIDRAMILGFYISVLVFAGVHILVNKKWYAILLQLPLGISLALIFITNDINGTGPIFYTSIFHSVWNIVTLGSQAMEGKIHYTSARRKRENKSV